MITEVFLLEEYNIVTGVTYAQANIIIVFVNSTPAY